MRMIGLSKQINDYRGSMTDSEVVDCQSQARDARISWALMSPFVILAWQYLLLASFSLFGTSVGSAIQMLSKLMVGAVYIWALPSVTKKHTKLLIISYWGTLTIFLFHFLIFPDNRQYILDIGSSFFLMCLPGFAYAMSVKELSVLRTTMKTASHYVFAASMILGLLILGGKVSIGVYSMPFSYYLLLPAIVYSDEFIDRLSIKYIAMAIIAILLILLLGARGPILCIGVFVILRMMKHSASKGIGVVFLHILFWGGLIICLVYLRDIMGYLYSLLQRFGFNARTLRLLAQAKISLSGRDHIYEAVLERIIDNNYILGYGIGGDRLILFGTYAHNFYLEVLVNFGIFIGGLLAILVSILFITSLTTRNQEKFRMYLIWFALGFVQLMVSSSYLINMNFWILLGLSLQKITGKREKILPFQ